MSWKTPRSARRSSKSWDRACRHSGSSRTMRATSWCWRQSLKRPSGTCRCRAEKTSSVSERGARSMAIGKKERLDAEFEAELLKKMLLIRRFEEKAAQMYGLKKIGGFCHLYIGQEAAAVGAIAAIDLAKDYTVGAYRDHGYALA